MSGFGDPAVLDVLNRRHTGMRFKQSAHITAVQSYVIGNIFHPDRLADVAVYEGQRMTDVGIAVGRGKLVSLRTGDGTDEQKEHAHGSVGIGRSGMIVPDDFQHIFFQLLAFAAGEDGIVLT